jgi:hypothetical protein
MLWGLQNEVSDSMCEHEFAVSLSLGRSSFSATWLALKGEQSILS